MWIAIASLTWFLGLLLLAALVARFAARRRVQVRLFESLTAGGPIPSDAAVKGRFLTRWLALAGYRRPGAAAGFIALSLVALGVGVSMAYALWISGLLAAADRAVSIIPGGIADMLRPAIYGAPWIIFAMLAAVPTLIVRRARRRRTAQVERDLPVTLELLATLAEAGLGFDGALDRILDSQPEDRALAEEFRTFQVEVLAGRPRVECLRRVARRLDVTAVTIFTSALVQAEQIGSGVAEVLRGQADDLRSRRRERAIEFSMALPVKLLFPLVICFLPGILLFALGPAFYEIFRLADTFGLTR
jgi:tight adherence protein C